MALLYGMHDEEGIAHVPDGGWCLDLIALNGKPKPKTYDARVNWLVRLDWGYDGAGTIPNLEDVPTYLQNLLDFVTGTTGVWGYIIGNEPNHQQEWPSGNPIEESRYCAVFIHAYDLVKRVSSSNRVSPAAIAPYQLSSIPYWTKMLNLCIASGVLPDFLSLHTYTRGSNPGAINADLPMNAPLQHCQSGFLAYKDFLNATPTALIDKPAIITEFDEYEAWEDKNTGVVQAAYENINYHNQHTGLNKVLGLLLYRWPNKDTWYIEGKQGVIDDFRAAVGRGYQSPPIMGATTVTSTTFIPAISSGTQAPAQPPRDIDQRLIDRGTKIIDATANEGDTVWKLIKAQFFPPGNGEGKSGGRHHVYVEAVDEDGAPVANVPFTFSWDGHAVPLLTNGKSGFDAGNQPFSEGKNGFTVSGDHADTVKGIGMGWDTPGGWNAGEHTSTLLRYQRQVVGASEPQQPAPTEPTQPAKTMWVNAPAGLNLRETAPDGKIVTTVPYGEPVTVLGGSVVDGEHWSAVALQDGTTLGYMFTGLLSPTAPSTPTPEPPPAPTGDNWSRALAFIHQWEGGFQNKDWDAGNWTGCKVGVGEKKGTNHGVSACAYPNLDIPNLTEQAADDIFFRDYWQRSGADKLPWPNCILALNAAINFHPLTAQRWIAESGGNALLFYALMLKGYRHSDAWPQAGNAWVDRMVDLGAEASK